MDAHGVARILWTGGWDSTFCVLSALLEHGLAVSPIYVIDPDRRSLRHELAALAGIRARLLASRPDAAARLAPLVFRDRAGIAPRPGIAEAYRALRARVYLGGQYEWLARLAAEPGMNDPEMAIHRGGNIQRLLAPLAEPRAEHGRPFFVLAPSPAAVPERELFGGFRFPVFDLAKADMARRARAGGFMDVMEMTWFCHKPRRDGRPCGVCHPCIYAMEEGMRRRFHWTARVRHAVSAKRRIHRWRARNPRADRILARVKRLTRGPGEEGPQA